MPILPTQKTKNKTHTRGSIWQTDIQDVFFRNRKRKIPIADLALFCRKAAYLLGAGLTIKAALPILQGQSLGAALNIVIPQVHKNVIKGASLSDALKTATVFPNFMIGYVAIGEKTAQLANVCEKLADYYEQQDQTKKELFAALMYPITVILMMIGVIVLAMATVLPGYASIFDASDIALPAITEILLNASAFLAGNRFLLLGGLVAFIITLAVFVRSGTGKELVSRGQLKIPLLRLGINFHLAQSLSLLLTSGIRVSDAMPLCVNLIDSICVKKDLNELSQNLADGMEFSSSLSRIPYIDPLLRDLASVGEKTGELPQTMEKCHRYFAANYMHSIKRLNKLIEPVITLTMGVLLTLLMLAVVLPTFELATAM